MAKRDRSITSAKLEKWSKEGRGQGHGEGYKPGLTIRDVASKSLVSRVPGKKVSRVHHLLSQPETRYYLILEWSDKVIDIREQFLLPLDETLRIADRLGIKHPTDPKTREYSPVSTDFLIDVLNDEGQKETKARTVKPAKELERNRILEKFEIERVYWIERGVDWAIVTENEISNTLAENIQLALDKKDLSDFPKITAKTIELVEPVLLSNLSATTPLMYAARRTDEQLNLESGTSLTIFYHLVANKIWLVDLEKPLISGEPITVNRSRSFLNVMGESK
jgi:hypothetical protein